MKIEEMRVSARTKSCLKSAGFEDITDIIDMTDEELLDIHNFNEKCLYEIKEVIKEVKENGGVNYKMFIQFDDKSYSVADLKQIIKDVWVYDLGRKKEEIKDVELYIKPEESVVYYVVNGTVEGCFEI